MMSLCLDTPSTGNVTAEIAYTGDSKRWEFPDYYYNKKFNITGTKGMTFEMILFDTVIAAGNSDDLTSTRTSKFDPLSGPASVPSADAQWKWVEATIAASTADYLWVGGHYPVYSACSHGPTPELITKLKPHLEK
jgi:hypothetical protein